MIRRILLALTSTALVFGLSASAALAGEITGNGKLLHVDDSKWGTGLHGRSFCAFSGQEDLQFFTDDNQTERKDEATKGDPSHAQSWGQIPKEVRDFIAQFGAHPGNACNPTSEFEE